MIKDQDISIVVQGPILYQPAFDITPEVTKLTCTRLKNFFLKVNSL
jgi:hypothetical protein